MPPRHVRIVRPPFDYRSHDHRMYEETVATFLVGYLLECGFSDLDVADFYLEPSTTIDSLLHEDVSDYVVCVRDTGEAVDYALRTARALRARTGANVWLYGHTARLSFVGIPEGVGVCIQDEARMATLLGIEPTGKGFEQGLTVGPYVPYIKLSERYRQWFYASIETTRGCHFPCDFCYINAGDNYEKRFMMRPNEAILEDLRTYRALGVRTFRFHDSEFLGANRKLYAQRRELLRSMASELAGEIFVNRIWVRCDTLTWFDDYALLKAAGIQGAFLGVESFHQPDLNAMNKRLRVEDIFTAIRGLAAVGINMNMSIITFNRNTTIESLRANIAALNQLYAEIDPQLLGSPNFVFRQEYTTKPAEKLVALGKSQLSGRTYVAKDLGREHQTIGGRTAYDADIEPYMELMRLLSYEYNQKQYDLTEYKLQDLDALSPWFAALGPFCLGQMSKFLDRYEAGTLTLDSLVDAREELFEAVGELYKLLPASQRGFATYQAHAAKLDYQGPVPLLQPEEYWVHAIPM